MEKKSCSYEIEVLDKLEKGILDSKTKDHIKECSICRESLSVRSWMNRFQELSENRIFKMKQLPASEKIWERAFNLSEQHSRLTKKALLPLIIPQVLFYLLSILAAIFLMFIFWPKVTDLPIIDSLLKGFQVFTFMSSIAFIIVLSILIYMTISEIKTSKT